MSRHFYYEIPNGHGEQPDAVFFFPDLVLDGTYVEATVGNTVRSPDIRPPRKVLIVGFRPAFEILKAASWTTYISDRLPPTCGPIEETVSVSVFEINGTFVCAHGTSPRKDLEQAIRVAGLSTIYVRRKCMVVSSPSLHFVKPSGDHTDRFIRAANALCVNEEILFIAACLLKHLNPAVTAIDCDSTGIFSLAYAAVALYNSLAGDVLLKPVVRSFCSYRAFSVGEEFPFQRESLVLISASTTGRLQKQLCDQLFVAKEKLVTIFSHPAKRFIVRTKGVVLCQLDNKRAIASARCYKDGAIKNFSARECPFCHQENRHPIPIDADNFFLDIPLVTPCVLTKNDGEEFHAALARLMPIEVSRCYVARQDNPGKDFEIYLDATGLLASKAFLKWLRTLIEKHRENPPARILRLTDDASFDIAKSICDEWARLGVNPPTAEVNLNSQIKTRLFDPETDAVIWVVASAMVGGRRLCEVSMHLRDFSGKIVYIVPIERTPSSLIASELRSNLRMGKGEPKYHAFEKYCSINLPKPNERKSSPWLKEKEFWNTCKNARQPESVKARFYLLDREAIGRPRPGLVNDLFLSDLKGEPLRLRGNFTFFPSQTKISRPLSQADVYMIMSAVLNKARGTRMLHILAATNFSRYNDGVVQAALLRGAYARELNYMGSKFDSEFIRDMLIYMITHRDSSSSEALGEFFLALAMKRLLLEYGDYESVRTTAKREIGKMPEMHRYLIGEMGPHLHESSSWVDA